MQSRVVSLLEVVSGKAVGFVLAICLSLYVFPVIGIYLDVTQVIEVTIFFTLLSLVREYLWRRLFNWIMIKGYLCHI